jgi:NADH dehydrogenase
MMEKKNIVILGAGFGGIAAAIAVARGLRSRRLLEKYQVVLVDRNDYQLYTPNLYRYAAASEDGPGDVKSVAWPIASLIGNLPVAFVREEITEIDLVNGDIHLVTGEEMKAEFVVIAMGSESNDFGIPGVAEHAIPLKTFANAQAIRTALAALIQKNPGAKIVVGGAGANGIEVAAEIKHRHPDASVTIVEAMPTVLPGLDAKVARIAAKRLADIGVTVALDAKIARVDASAVVLTDNTTTPFDLMVWTAGVKTPGLVTGLPLRENRGKPTLAADMLCLPQTPDLKLLPMVYAVGDSVCFMDPATEHPMPSVAPVAIDQGEVVAWNVLEDILKKESLDYKPTPKTYAAKNYPYVIVVGGVWAVAKIGPFVVRGWPGWIFKRLIEIDYRLSLLL